ncbi:hypothetical protein ATE71_10390 [Sphingopyxis sp. H115]|nr:hypothetical protein ATE71_10390 [Sphingopyxis sp. H115]
MNIRLSVGDEDRARGTDKRCKLLNEPFGNIPQTCRSNFSIDMQFRLPPSKFIGHTIIENGSVH